MKIKAPKASAMHASGGQKLFNFFINTVWGLVLFVDF